MAIEKFLGDIYGGAYLAPPKSEDDWSPKPCPNYGLSVFVGGLKRLLETAWGFPNKPGFD